MGQSLSQGPAAPGSINYSNGQDQHETKDHGGSSIDYWLALIRTFTDDALKHKLPLSISITHEIAMGI